MSESGSNLKPITVFVCEAQPIVIEGLRRVLEPCSDIHLVGESAAVTMALEAIESVQPNIVLVDLSIGTKAAFDELPRVRVRSSRSHVILWANSLTEVESFRALQIGARGILKKTLPVTAVIDCIRAVGQGNIWIENSISTQVVGFLNRRNMPRLTPREQEIVSLICRGMKNRQIAEALSITTGTVKVHLMHIFEKTGVKDRFELALEAHKLMGADKEIDSAANLRSA